jgi:hypothetical protein
MALYKKTPISHGQFCGLLASFLKSCQTLDLGTRRPESLILTWVETLARRRDNKKTSPTRCSRYRSIAMDVDVKLK